MDLASLVQFKLAAGCGSPGILPSLYDGLCRGNNVVIQSVSDITKIGANGLRIAVMLAGLLAVVAFMAAGFFYVISVGDPGRVKRAKDIMQNAVIGLIITIAAYAAITFIAERF